MKSQTREGQVCQISKGTHKKTQSGFRISTEEANVAEISCHRRFQGGLLSSALAVTQSWFVCGDLWLLLNQRLCASETEMMKIVTMEAEVTNFHLSEDLQHSHSF